MAIAEPAAPPASRPSSSPPDPWSESAAGRMAAAVDDPRLGRCVYVSTLLGADSSLVLHGAGNTSVKSELRGPDGVSLPMLWVKGTGHDLARATPSSFAPVALEPLRRLTSLEDLDDTELVRLLRRAVLDAAAPEPSVETLTHAILPHRYVLHAHPDAVLAATSVPGGAAVARRLFGPTFAVIPWAAPGLALAREVDKLWRARGSDGLRGIVLLHHGVLTFGEDARVAWEALVDLVARAAAALPSLSRSSVGAPGLAWSAADIAALRQEVSRLAGRPMIVTLDDSAAAREFAVLPAAAELAARGPLSACNVLRTKRTAALVPGPGAIATALEGYARRYGVYFRRCAGAGPFTMHDAAPRVILAPGAGVFSCGRTAADATAVRDLWRHTMPAVLAAERLGGYRPLGARGVFEVEYGPLHAGRERGEATPLAGRVALVTGAAGEVGGAIARELLAMGAAVAGVDQEPVLPVPGYLGVVADVRGRDAAEAVIASVARRFGGLDLLISIEPDATAQLPLLRAARPLLARAASPGAAVLIRSGDLGPREAARLVVALGGDLADSAEPPPS